MSVTPKQLRIVVREGQLATHKLQGADQFMDIPLSRHCAKDTVSFVAIR